MKNQNKVFGYYTIGSKECLLTVLLPLVVAACGDVNTIDADVSPYSQQGVAIPDAVRRAVLELEPGELTAILYCGKDSTGVGMLIIEDFAQGSCENMSTAVSHEIRVEFLYELNTSRDTYYLLAEAIANVTVDSDGTDFSYLDSHYRYPDDNNNGFTNYQDLIDGRDPAILPCEFGLSRIGQCVL